MEIIFAVIISILVVVGGSIGIWVLMRHHRLRDLEDEVDEYIEGYLSRMTGANRFVTSEELLAKAFPEYDRKDMREIWKRLIARKRVGRDPMDESMIFMK